MEAHALINGHKKKGPSKREKKRMREKFNAMRQGWRKDKGIEWPTKKAR